MTEKPKRSKEFIEMHDKLNDAFIEFELHWTRELIRFVPAHRPAK